MLRFAPVCSFICLLMFSPFSVRGADDAGIQFYKEKIEPIFAKNCFECHGNGKAKGGLSIYTRELVLKGGESGPGVDLEDHKASMILDALNYESYEMPPSGKLPQEQINLVAEWIKRGAPMPVRTDVIEIKEEHGPPQVNEETKNHWSFRPLKQTPVPQVDDKNWQANPIDAFVYQNLKAKGLTPNPQADKATLVRRLYYNLLGLPPTPEQVNSFVNDDSPEAYEKLVDSLLKSPHYGEHWARYWLDLVRYAESNSFERDDPKPFVWKYRDYVIRSFNEDKPYSQFILEQLAGDELENATPESIIATGYYRLGQWDDEPADPKLAMYDELDDIIATTSQGMLGLSMNCARCHDHKLDPLPQADYYSMVAFFRNIRRYGVRSGQSVFEASVRSIATPEQDAEHAEELSKYQARVGQLRKELDVVEKKISEQLVGGERDDFKNDSVRLRIIRKHKGKLITQKEFEKYAAKRKAWNELRNHPPQSAEQALAVKEHGIDPPATHILIRGNPGGEGKIVEPIFPTVLTSITPEITPTVDGKSSGRRLALAKWITDESNPLPIRVFVNRVWQWNYGRGLVRTPNDFGLTGNAPTHPDLLEWLAVEFLNNGQSVKKLTRLMVMSNTWKMSSTPNKSSYDKDPLNDNYWRFDMRRLRAEEIRDSILAVNGTINLDKMYGPSIYPIIPAEVLAGQSRPGAGWGKSSEEDRRRRSIYIHIKRSLAVPLLAAFDVADTDFTCPIRFATTQPTQALGMLNSSFLNEEGEEFARELKQEAGADASKQVQLALNRVMQRPPTQQEIDRGLKLLKSLENDFGQDKETALKNFCLMALNLNEFVYLD
ncbi:PSD1 and planctomycete cytochrome C domain-containing protein [Thalassoglobus sp.]|uniref:PSD1 and planctomycete cytochrome C domain-containing protein n=1 Tax=Thalassoglobus sp. TaxID=2795869 RepID=UPI003AA9134B